MLPPDRAHALAAALDLDARAAGVCLACLAVVAFALERGEEREAARTVRELTPDLWAEGLALPARAALERARRRGLADAERAIADLAEAGPRSPIARAIVARLGTDLLEELRAGRERERGATVTALDDRRGGRR